MRGRVYADGMKTWRCAVGLTAGVMHLAAAWAQEPELPRPGTVTVADVAGRLVLVADGQRKALTADDRVRVGATVATERRSMATLHFSNGAAVQLGSDAELEIEEFGQAPATSASKFAELKAEPTISRTRLRLLRGDIALEVKPLRVARGSTFTVTLAAGMVKISDGAVRMAITMSEFGLGVCTVELLRGTAEFEPAGGASAPLVAGRTHTLAVELDRATGSIKVGAMPKAAEKK
ncbi:MAG: hypothetical protein Q8N18_11510 [Opitutaceae bacterium]|nr:hypothetical protein [Opitutaceae bacterium]